MNLVQSEPKFTVQISKASFVVVPAAVEINRAVQSLLEHYPAPTGCCLITNHVKGAGIVRIDGINTADSFSIVVELSTAFLQNCSKKEEFFNSTLQKEKMTGFSPRDKL